MNGDELGPLLERLPFATIDHLRPVTQGHQEVIFSQGKTVEQVVTIAERLVAAGRDVPRDPHGAAAPGGVGRQVSCGPGRRTGADGLSAPVA